MRLLMARDMDASARRLRFFPPAKSFPARRVRRDGESGKRCLNWSEVERVIIARSAATAHASLAPRTKTNPRRSTPICR